MLYISLLPSTVMWLLCVYVYAWLYATPHSPPSIIIIVGKIWEESCHTFHIIIYMITCWWSVLMCLYSDHVGMRSQDIDGLTILTQWTDYFVSHCLCAADCLCIILLYQLLFLASVLHGAVRVALLYSVLWHITGNNDNDIIYTAQCTCVALSTCALYTMMSVHV